MTTRNPVQTTVIACAAMALAAFAIAAVVGHPRAGLALAAGLLVGSANGVLISRSLRAGMPFQAASLGRLGVLSAAGLGIGFLLGLDVVAWTLFGLAAAQLALAAAGVFTLMRR
jgi:hypothetical protein